MKLQLQAAYLDYFNDYLTIEKFADDNELTEAEAQILITLGRSIHERLTQPVEATVTMRINGSLTGSRKVEDAEAYLNNLSSRLEVNVPLALSMLHSGHTVTVTNEDSHTTFEVKKL